MAGAEAQRAQQITKAPGLDGRLRTRGDDHWLWSLPNDRLGHPLKCAELLCGLNTTTFEPEDQIDQRAITLDVELLDRCVIDLQQR